MRSLTSVPTGTAWTLVAVGAASVLAGWLLGWVESFVLAASCLVALLTAIPFVVGRGTVLIERTIDPRRVTVGDRAVAEMHVTNSASRPSVSLTIDERIDGNRVSIDVPGLAPLQQTEFLYTLPTNHRGKYQIGPASIGRGDPLGLLHRSIGETKTEEFYVHPRTVPAKALSAGFAKDLEGPTFDSSPAGDVAFHAIREYEPGDDPRHVHWMSTARMNSLMVRHYVDNRRPQLGVLVDGRIAAASPESFELAIEVAGSLGVSGVKRETPISVWVDDSVLVGRERPRSIDELLDALAEVGPAPTQLVPQANRLLRTERGTSVLVLVTAASAVDLVPVVEQFRRRVALIVIAVGSTGQPIFLPGARVLNCSDLDHFAHLWNAMA